MENESPTETPIDSLSQSAVLDLLLTWSYRISDLADELEEVKCLELRKQADLRSGIQERSQCMIDLLRLIRPESEMNQPT